MIIYIDNLTTIFISPNATLDAYQMIFATDQSYFQCYSGRDCLPYCSAMCLCC